MERRNDDYSDGNDRHRPVAYSRPTLDSAFEEPGAETPGPDPIHSAFEPITGPREGFMPVVVPQPQLSSTDNQQSNQRPRDSFQPLSSSFHHDRQRNQQHQGTDRRSTPAPNSDAREVMPPPQLPPPDRGQPTNRTGRVEAVRDRSNTATTNSTHNSIEPEYNRTPIPSSSTNVRDNYLETREIRLRDFEPLPHHTSGSTGLNRSNYATDGRRDHFHSSPDMREPLSGQGRSNNHDHHTERGYVNRNGINGDNGNSHYNSRHSPHGPLGPNPPGSSATRRAQSPYHHGSQQQSRTSQIQETGGTQQRYASPTRTAQQSLGLSSQVGVVHYGESPMDERYDDFNTHSRPAPPSTSNPSRQPPQQAHAPTTARRTRQVIVEVPMETDYAESGRTAHIYSAPASAPAFQVHSSLNSQVPSQASAGGTAPAVQSGTVHSAQSYSAPNRSAPAPQPAAPNPAATPYTQVAPADHVTVTRPASDNHPASHAPSANRTLFNVSNRPQQHNNEPPISYSSLPPPPSNQPNQVIQPQVAISPTAYHQPPQPAQSNIGFSNYCNNQQQQNSCRTQQNNCHTCIHQQQHYNHPISHGYPPYPSLSQVSNPPSQPPPPPHQQWNQPMEHSGARHDNYQTRQAGTARSRHSSPHSRALGENGHGGGNGSGEGSRRGGIRNDTHMDSDADDSFENPRRDHHRHSFRRHGRSRNDLRGNEHTPPRSRASSREDSFERSQSGHSGHQSHQSHQVQGNQNSSNHEPSQQNQVALAGPSGIVAMQSRSTNELLSLSSVSQQLQMQGLNHTMASMLVPILKDQGVQQGCREMHQSFQIQNQLNDMKQQMAESYKTIQENYQQKLTELQNQIIPALNSAIENKNNINDAPRTPQSCNSDRSQSRHPDLIRTPDSSVSGTYSDTDSPHSGGRGRGRAYRQSRTEPYPSDRRDFSRGGGDFPPSPNQVHRSGRLHGGGGARIFGGGGNSGGYSSAQSSPIDSAMEDNFQPNSISPTQNQYSDLSVDQVCEKLQEWCVSEEIIENFRRENIQGRHLNYLTEYMIKKGLLSPRTEHENAHHVRPIAARLGPLKTVCRALKMHVGQAKELQTTSTEREAIGLGTMNAVSVWLRSIGLSEYDRRFIEEQVYGSALLDLSESNLIELGMDKLGDRITFMISREMLN